MSSDSPPSPTIDAPDVVVEIAERLEREGFEAWCVGGAVRDALLGHRHLDWDLATSATPEQVRAVFGPRRTIPVGEAFGTVGVLDRDRRMHEVTTFRRDVRTDGRHAEVEFGVSLDDDLARRDFTINAIAFHPLRHVLHDPLGGRRDLEGRLVRAVGEPAARMREDRLRALRAIRFAGRLGFDIEPATWTAIVESAPHLGRLSAERVKQEIEKTLEQVQRPSEAFRRWRDAGAFATLVPALAAIDDAALAVVDCLAWPGGARADAAV
ncbi:MAG TPA: CCA tRNA nucleotidyltransferase, partial [Gemmatimonadaceae bacterium]|nr:CCA tRNA nucleotidyltransferase [Gemmatimonadaceae bacterium]